MRTLVRDGEALAAEGNPGLDWSPAGGGDVVLAYDGTSEARAALYAAVGQVGRFGGKLLIVYGVEPPGPRVGEGFKEHRRALEDLGSRLIAQAAEEARAACVEAETMLVPQTQADALAAVAADRQARIVVVGTRGEGLLRGAIAGSLAYKLLGVCDIPVLCVRAQES